MKINDVEFKIKESWYNRTQVQEDGVIHKVGEEKFPMFTVSLDKNYYLSGYGEGMRELVVDAVIEDLEQVVQRLKQIRQQELIKQEDLER